MNEYRQELHEEAVATGQQTAEAEEHRGEARRDRGNGRDAEEREEGEAPDFQQVCSLAFGNSDIYGGSWPNP